MMNNDVMIKVTDATVRFNKATENFNGLKEYVIKMLKGELMFQEFLALKDVSFEVKRGESWGLIGTNGSGKSTLLKLICGILKPYKGTVEVHGNIAPLIELGAGFDGELTARENIYLNGALLGHKKAFMQQHFDEIIEFAELQDFVDVPIKNFRLVPSYKRMCITILKNDTSCQYMGFGQTKDELQKKQEAMEKWETFL